MTNNLIKYICPTVTAAFDLVSDISDQGGDVCMVMNGDKPSRCVLSTFDNPSPCGALTQEPTQWDVDYFNKARCVMSPQDTLIHLAINNASQPNLLAEIKAVTSKLMSGVKPTEAEMTAVGFAYQRDPIMCTLDFQDLQDFINSKFGE